MSCRTRLFRTWLSAFMVLFMVAVLPACWYGALERALASGQGFSTANSNEEREEKEEHDVEERESLGRRPPPPPREIPRTADIVRVLAAPRVQPLAASIAQPPEPSRFSERRLI
jgi:hypothetical protein